MLYKVINEVTHYSGRRGLLFLVLIVSFLAFVPFQKILEAIQEASPSFFWLSCLLGLPTIYFGGVQLWMLIHRQEIQVTTLKLFEINFVVKALSFFSPASALGSLLRWYKLSGGGKSAEALTAVAVNCLFNVFTAMVFGLFWLIGSVNRSSFNQPWILFGFLLLVVLMWLLTTRYSPPMLNWVQERTKNNHRNWVQKFSSLCGRLSTSLRVYSSLSGYELMLLVIVGLSSEYI